ncbi:MAG: hypothetical protein WC209_05730 [Ignavibacteriaceae bacterium]|jgi:hypothetical protein
MVISNTINNESPPIPENLLEAATGKFKQIAREFFQFEAKSSIEYLTSIKESVKFFNLDVPSQLNEVFVRYEEAPLFWIYDSPIVQYLEDILKIYFGKSNDLDHYKTIKECYTKWIVIKSENEKRYFANSALNYIDKSSSKHNFFYLILKAVLYTFEKSLANTATAISLFNKSLEVLNSTKVSDNYKDELQYLIKVFMGFAYLKQKESAAAGDTFRSALSTKPHGITAKFYLALTEVQLSQNETAVHILKELCEYDFKRIEYSVGKTNPVMFRYFVNNSVVYNLFYQRDFAVIVDEIESDLQTVFTPDPSIILKLKSNLSKLKDLEMDDYYSDETKKILTFLEKLTDHYFESKNILVISSYRFLQDKFNESAKAIFEAIKLKYASEIKNKLKMFDDQVEEKRYAITLLTNDFESLKMKQKEKLAATLKEIEKKIEEYILLIESKINAIPMETKHDPVYSFRNMMTYNIIVSSLLFFIGGCSGYSTQYFRGGMEFKEVFGQLMLAGIKWGLGTFLVGFLLALIVAVSTFISRSAYKQKLLQKINWLKNQKELEISGAKKEFEAKDKLLKENFDERIEDLKKSIEDLLKDRTIIENETKAQMDEELKKESAPLIAMITV